MTERDDALYLRHILEAAEQIQSYVAGVDEPAFEQTRMLQDAVVRQLEIMGEAAKQLSSEIRRANPQIRWQDIAGMRDKLIHHYFGVDLKVVWETARRDVPALARGLAELLSR